MYVCKFQVSMLQKGQVFLTSNFLSPTLIFNSVASFIREWTFYLTNLSSVQLLSYVQLFLTTWTAACQAFLCITNSWSLLKLMSSSWWCHPTISSSIILFCSCLQSFPASGSFPMSQFFTSGAQSIGVSASAAVLPMNIQDWFPLRWTGWISLQSKGLSSLLQQHSSKASVLRRSAFFMVQLSHPYMTTRKIIALTRWTESFCLLSFLDIITK